MSERVYCGNEEEFYDLAGSGGGWFTFAGFYAFDEDRDVWSRVRDSALTEAEFSEHITKQHAALDRIEHGVRGLRRQQRKISAQLDQLESRL